MSTTLKGEVPWSAVKTSELKKMTQCLDKQLTEKWQKMLNCVMANPILLKRNRAMTRDYMKAHMCGS